MILGTYSEYCPTTDVDFSDMLIQPPVTTDAPNTGKQNGSETSSYSSTTVNKAQQSVWLPPASLSPVSGIFLNHCEILKEIYKMLTIFHTDSANA